MRIIFLSPSGNLGGAEVALLNILASLRAAQPEWELELIVSEAGAVAAGAAALGVFTTVLPFPDQLARLGDASVGLDEIAGRLRLLRQSGFATPAVAGYVSRLRRLLRQRAPDVVHTNGFKMHLLGALAKPRATPLVWHIHDYVQPRPMMAKLMKLSRQRCDLALVNSNSVGRDVAQACGAGLSIRTIYNGIDTRVFAPGGGRLDLDSLAGLSAPAPAIIRVGMLATMARWKGHEVFLRALSLIDPEFPLRGYVIGEALYQTDGSQTSVAALKAVAQRLGLAERVGFTGFVAEPAAAIRSLDIVVHASTQPEPFGLVIVEALACGRAVIVSEGGGAAELIQTENGNGPIALTHPPGNAEQLAACIKQLATDPHLRERLGAAGRASATERFNATRLGTELAPIYRKLVGRTRH